jgi:hypothetical protein
MADSDTALPSESNRPEGLSYRAATQPVLVLVSLRRFTNRPYGLSTCGVSAVGLGTGNSVGVARSARAEDASASVPSVLQSACADGWKG